MKSTIPTSTDAKSTFILRHANEAPSRVVMLAKREGIRLTASYVRSIQWMLRTATKALLEAEQPGVDSEIASSVEQLKHALTPLPPPVAPRQQQFIAPYRNSVMPTPTLPHAATMPAAAPSVTTIQPGGDIWEGLFVEAAGRIGVERALALLAEIDRARR